ncbi:MAG: DUF1926 domain-containing protein [Deltaproteobacteria bacterium]|nr:MAG: DUF1926 domain-containing protein [Deltaproteobacteria bacterium]
MGEGDGKVYLLLCFHNHQPVGNFEEVMEEAAEKAYIPFLRVLAGYPEIKVTLHYSGHLLTWLLKKKEEFSALLYRLVERGQVEILGGGVYEPVLPVIPERDRVGQLEKMAEKIRSLFGRKPRGIWLAERVWEPSLPLTLRKAGVEYLPLDDYHFLLAGASGDELDGYFITEYNGHVVKVFPGLELLRYTIPFRDPGETIDYLRTLRRPGRKAPAAVFADDGEKFGIWPGTYSHVYEGGWLKRFFDKIVEEKEWLRTSTFASYVDRFPPRGRIYLPSASYPEMGEWTLPPKKAEVFGTILRERREGRLGEMKDLVSGGNFRAFFRKYEESNQMHKRMLIVSEMVNRALPSAGEAERDLMVDSLYRAQANDPFWHGVFGGLYLPHLRDAFYRNLLRAEKTASRILKKGKEKWIEILRGDLNRDGEEEVIIRSGKVVLLLHPSDGGTVSEFSLLERGFNALNVLTRRREGYHSRLFSAGGGNPEREAVSIHDTLQVKEGVDPSAVVFDRFVLRSFRDLFFEEGTVAADLTGRGREPLFVNEGRCPVPSCMMSGEKGAVRMSYSVTVGGETLEIEKVVIMEGKREEARFRVRVLRLGPGEKPLVYVNRWHLNFLSPRDEKRVFVAYPVDAEGFFLEEEKILSGIEGLGVRDGWQGFTFVIEPSLPVDAVVKPVHTVSLSESGLEKVYQGSEVDFLLPLPEEKKQLEVEFRVVTQEA